MKVSELEGVLLDYWVAKAEGFRPKIKNGVCAYNYPVPIVFNPSTNWREGGPIIEREKIRISPIIGANDEVARWEAACYPHNSAGPTPLIAAMRAYVASKFGEDVPEEP